MGNADKELVRSLNTKRMQQQLEEKLYRRESDLLASADKQLARTLNKRQSQLQLEEELLRRAPCEQAGANEEIRQSLTNQLSQFQTERGAYSLETARLVESLTSKLDKAAVRRARQASADHSVNSTQFGTYGFVAEQTI